MSSAADLIRMGLPLFADIDPADLDALDLGWSEQSFTAGSTVFSQDDNSRDVMFLLDGALLAVFWTEDGREIVFTRFPKGSCFGELSAIDGEPRSLAVYAKSDVRIMRLEQASFRRLMDEVPLFRDRVIQDLVRRIRNLTRKSMELTTYSIEQRVCSYLVTLALDAGRFAPGAVITGAPTHAEIASSIGANREMVSRTISKLSRRGVIKPGRQRIEICDPVALSDAI